MNSPKTHNKRSFFKDLKNSLYENGKLQPQYFWISIFLMLIAVTVIVRLTTKMGQLISDNLILGMFGFVGTWVAVFTVYKNRKNKTKK